MLQNWAIQRLRSKKLDGGYYVGAQQFVVPTGLAAGSFPTILAGDLIQGLGAPLVLSTTTTLTPAQFPQ